MQRVIIEFPVNKEGEIADIIGAHGFVTLICRNIDGALFDKKIRMQIAVPEDKADTAIAKFKDYIKEK